MTSHLLSDTESSGARPIWLVAEQGLSAWLEVQTPAVRSWARAQGFLGEWALPLDANGEVIQLDIAITDADGNVAAVVASPFGASDVTQISRSGDDLVLRYRVEVDGQSAPIALTLRPNGTDLAASVDYANGTFVTMGTARRK